MKYSLRICIPLLIALGYVSFDPGFFFGSAEKFTAVPEVVGNRGTPKRQPDGNAAFNPDRVSFEHITPAEGISSPIVNVILQDGVGFLWLGTALGLNRYDGYNFINFTHSDDPESLRNDDVSKIYQDKNGMLWFGTGGGLDRFERERGVFSHVDTRGQVYDILEDSQGVLWVGFWHGLYGYDPTEGELIYSFEGAGGI